MPLFAVRLPGNKEHYVNHVQVYSTLHANVSSVAERRCSLISGVEVRMLGRQVARRLIPHALPYATLLLLVRLAI